MSRIVGRRKQRSEDTTTAVGCVVVRTAVISGEERLDCVVASEGVLICLPNVL